MKGLLGCHSSRPWAGRPGVIERTFAFGRVTGNKSFVSHADIIYADIINADTDIINADIINVSYRMDFANVHVTPLKRNAWIRHPFW